MTDDTGATPASSLADSPLPTTSRVGRVFMWADGFLLLGAVVVLITYLNWDRDGWTVVKGIELGHDATRP